MQQILIHPSAQNDLEESFEWYAQRSPRTALRFLNAVDLALNVVAGNPLRFASRDGIHREAPVKKFPFRIVYRLDSTGILVIALAHHRRNPGYWATRSRP